MGKISQSLAIQNMSNLTNNVTQLQIWSGQQPIHAEDLPMGTLLATGNFTLLPGAFNPMFPKVTASQFVPAVLTVGNAGQISYFRFTDMMGVCLYQDDQINIGLASQNVNMGDTITITNFVMDYDSFTW